MVPNLRSLLLSASPRLNATILIAITCVSFLFWISPARAVSRGDINKDGTVDLADAVLCLQVLNQAPSELTGSYDEEATDVNGDARIGIAEALYALCRAGGIRTPENTPAAIVNGPDGSTLIVPAGALNGGATIAITEAGDTTVDGQCYESIPWSP